MSQSDLPPPTDRVVAAINAGDTEGFLSFFDEDGVVDDWGKRYVGRDEIKTWSDRELIGARGVLTVGSVDVDGDEVSFTADWKSSHFTGPGHYVFRVKDSLVAEWRISG